MNKLLEKIDKDTCGNYDPNNLINAVEKLVLERGNFLNFVLKENFPWIYKVEILKLQNYTDEQIAVGLELVEME